MILLKSISGDLWLRSPARRRFRVGRCVNQPPLQRDYATYVIRAERDAPVVQSDWSLHGEDQSPLLAYYRSKGLLYVIDATSEPETVFGR